MAPPDLESAQVSKDGKHERPLERRHSVPPGPAGLPGAPLLSAGPPRRSALGEQRGWSPAAPGCEGRAGSPPGLPAWGRLTALQIRTQELRWQEADVRGRLFTAAPLARRHSPRVENTSAGGGQHLCSTGGVCYCQGEAPGPLASFKVPFPSSGQAFQVPLGHKAFSYQRGEELWSLRLPAPCCAVLLPQESSWEPP